MTDKNTPAFPEIRPDPEFAGESCSGMSLHTWFAGMAMQGRLAHSGWPGSPDKGLERYAKTCFEIADAMIAEMNARE